MRMDLVEVEFEGRPVRAFFTPGAEPWLVQRDLLGIACIGSGSDQARRIPSICRMRQVVLDPADLRTDNGMVDALNARGVALLLDRARKPAAQRLKAWVAQEMPEAVKASYLAAVRARAEEMVAGAAPKQPGNSGAPAVADPGPVAVAAVDEVPERSMRDLVKEAVNAAVDALPPPGLNVDRAQIVDAFRGRTAKSSIYRWIQEVLTERRRAYEAQRKAEWRARQKASSARAIAAPHGDGGGAEPEHAGVPAEAAPEEAGEQTIIEPAQGGDVVPFMFGDHKLRVVMVGDDPWFVASDIASALGRGSSTLIAANLAADEKGHNVVSTPGGPQRLVTISESGLYRVTMRSNAPDARRFQDWVTREVLPSIRKTGSYSAAPVTGGPVDLLNDPDFLRSALIKWTGEVSKLRQANTVLALEKQRVETVARKHEDVLKLIVASNDCLTITLAAKTLGIGPRKFVARMQAAGWIYRGSKGTLLAMEPKRAAGYLVHKEVRLSGEGDGGDRYVIQVLVTPAGLVKLARMLGVTLRQSQPSDGAGRAEQTTMAL